MPIRRRFANRSVVASASATTRVTIDPTVRQAMVADGGLRAVRHQPRGRVIEGVGVTGTVPRSRHLRGDDPMLGAAHPWRVRFQERPDLTEVQGPPPPPDFA